MSLYILPKVDTLALGDLIARLRLYDFSFTDVKLLNIEVLLNHKNKRASKRVQKFSVIWVAGEKL